LSFTVVFLKNQSVWQTYNRILTIIINPLELHKITRDKSQLEVQTIRQYQPNPLLSQTLGMASRDKAHSMEAYLQAANPNHNSKMWDTMCLVSPFLAPTLLTNQLPIGKTIGKGTFGKVKLGNHNLTGEKVRIKSCHNNSF
jgi:hypothetical protein